MSHTCPPFEIQAPHGAAGEIDRAVTQDTILWVNQTVRRFPYDDVTLIAELLVDEAVVAVSEPATITPLDADWLHLRFQFPPCTMRTQFVGIRYRASLADGRVLPVTMGPLR
jgi:hypothetical protein